MLRDEHFRFFASYIERELGIVYADHNRFQLQSRLEEIAKLQGLASVEEVFSLAKTGITGAFRQLLLDTATNNETSFFRDPKVFRAIEEAVLKGLKPGEKLRIWSAASSTGQEAMSLAMLIKEFGAKTRTDPSFEILGTDISDRVLRRAREGAYTQLEVQRGLPSPMLVKYFRKGEKDQWLAAPDLQCHLVFRPLNLKEPFSFAEKFHLVLCRNVLIYQSVEGKADILARITAQLVPGGTLVLGAGESLLGLSSDYEQIAVEGAILYVKKDAAARLAA